MPPFSFASLRVRLIFLVLLEVLPLLGLTLYTDLEERRAESLTWCIRMIWKRLQLFVKQPQPKEKATYLNIVCTPVQMLEE
jgi:hypothetical protein